MTNLEMVEKYQLVSKFCNRNELVFGLTFRGGDVQTFVIKSLATQKECELTRQDLIMSDEQMLHDRLVVIKEKIERV